MRHRKAEVQRVVDLLEDESYESAEELAKSIIEEVYAAFRDREWYGLAWGPYAYGPIMTKTEADKLSGQLEGLPRVRPLKSVTAFEGVLKAANPSVTTAHCEECSHPRFAHGFSNHAGCIVRYCPCRSTFA